MTKKTIRWTRRSTLHDVISMKGATYDLDEYDDDALEEERGYHPASIKEMEQEMIEQFRFANPILADDEEDDKCCSNNGGHDESCNKSSSPMPTIHIDDDDNMKTHRSYHHRAVVSDNVNVITYNNDEINSVLSDNENNNNHDWSSSSSFNKTNMNDNNWIGIGLDQSTIVIIPTTTTSSSSSSSSDYDYSSNDKTKKGNNDDTKSSDARWLRRSRGSITRMKVMKRRHEQKKLVQQRANEKKTKHSTESLYSLQSSNNNDEHAVGQNNEFADLNVLESVFDELNSLLSLHISSVWTKKECINIVCRLREIESKLLVAAGFVDADNEESRTDAMNPKMDILQQQQIESKDREIDTLNNMLCEQQLNDEHSSSDIANTTNTKLMTTLMKEETEVDVVRKWYHRLDNSIYSPKNKENIDPLIRLERTHVKLKEISTNKDNIDPIIRLQRTHAKFKEIL